jgi:serine/threonine-protein kinase RsbW
LTRQRTFIALKLRNRPSATGELRAAVDRVADECELAGADRFELKLAATEAVTNVLRDAAEDSVVDVTVACRGASVDIEVGPRSSAAPSRGTAAWGPEADGGRGIPIMIALVDEVEFTRTGAGTRVRMRKRVAPESEAA